MPDVFRFTDRWQSSLRELFRSNDPGVQEMALAQLETRDRDLEVFLQQNVNLGPRGRVAFATTAVDQAGITTEAALTGLTVTFVAQAKRYYRITAHTMHLKDATAGTTRSIIRENSTNVGFALRGSSPASTFQTIEHSVIRTVVTGSVTYSLRAVSDAGAVTISNSSDSGFILVEDIGGF